MKGPKAMTGAERHARHMERLNLAGGTRLSVTLSPEALAALEALTVAQQCTKKAAMEAALIGALGAQ